MAAAKVKVIELAKELGVTSKDLMVAAEETRHKGVRAMTPLDATLANALRASWARGELPKRCEDQARRQAEVARKAELEEACLARQEGNAGKPKARQWS